MDRSGGGSGGHSQGSKSSRKAIVILQVGNDDDLNWGDGAGDERSRVGLQEEKRMDGDWQVPEDKGKEVSHLEKGWSASQHYPGTMGKETEALRSTLIRLTQYISGHFGLEARNPHSKARAFSARPALLHVYHMGQSGDIGLHDLNKSLQHSQTSWS